MAADFNLVCVTTAASKLRSWALTHGVSIAGPPLVRLAGLKSCRVHLPVGAEPNPRPDTDVAFDRCPGGAFAELRRVPFREADRFTSELLVALRARPFDTAFEFHSVDGHFATGDLVVISERDFAAKPLSIALGDFASGERPAGGVRVITLARQRWAGGSAVATGVARQLAFHVMDYGVLERAALEAGVPSDMVADAAIHRRFFERMLFAIGRMPALYPAYCSAWDVPFEASQYTAAKYRSFVEGAIRDIADQGDVVILGHGAQFVLADRSDTLRVLITGSRELRARRCVDDGGSDSTHAEEMTCRADEEREAYFREFYHAGWSDPATYDLVINTDRISASRAIQTIVDAAKDGD